MNSERNNEDRVAYSSYDKRIRLKRNIRIITVLILILLLVFLIGYFVLTTYFDIETVIVDGTGKYSYVEIKEKSGVTEGQIIFTVSERKIEEKLKRAFPFVKRVEVIKEYPSSVNIVIYEETPLFYIFYDGEYYVLTNELKVLERFEDQTRLKIMYPDLKEIKAPEIYKIVAPNRIVFENERDLRYLCEFLVELSEWEGFERTEDIDISEKYDITFLYDNRITVYFGNRYDLEDKLKIADAMLATFSDDWKGSFFIKNIEESIAREAEKEESDDLS